MTKNLYSIYDKKLERYNDPGFAEDDHTIMVSLQRAAKDKNSFLYINSDDLALYCVGTFDDKIGKITTPNEPRLVCDVANLVIKEV